MSKTLAEELKKENERLRRKHVHVTRPLGPLTMDEAAALHRRMEGTQPPCEHPFSKITGGGTVCTTCGAITSRIQNEAEL